LELSFRHTFPRQMPIVQSPHAQPPELASGAYGYFLEIPTLAFGLMKPVVNAFPAESVAVVRSDFERCAFSCTFAVKDSRKPEHLTGKSSLAYNRAWQMCLKHWLHPQGGPYSTS
jgi:hypothetical protein